MLKYESQLITLAEVPGEVSLSFLVTGCPLRCPGCHSVPSRDGSKGMDLTIAAISNFLSEDKGFITCVLFLGGEWDVPGLETLLKFCKSEGLATALYTGRNRIPKQLTDNLDYIKTGPYIQRLGGLENPNTNQKLIKIKTGEDLTPKFWRKL